MRRTVSVVILFAMVVSGCATGGASSSIGPAAASGGASSVASAALASLPPEARTLTVAFTTPGFSAVPLLEALDQMKAEGYTIETPTLEQSELTVQGVASGQFQFSTGTASGILTAIQSGAGLVMLSDRVANEWTLYGDADVPACKDLHGRPTGIGSEGAVSTAMLRAWVAQECPSASPQYLVLGQSPTRNAAFIAGQIDANVVELSDAIRLETDQPGKFHLLANFSKTLPNLHPTPLYGNAVFVEKYPQVAKDLLRAQLTVHRSIAADPAYLARIVSKWLPDLDDKFLIDVAKEYVDLGLFPRDGGLTAEGVTYTIGFFEQAGTIKPGLSAKDVFDASFAQSVVADLPN